MAWYYGTYSCGHEGRVNIIGPTKHREWKKERHFENICEECFKKQKEEENEKALEESKEMELPELKGSEKQIAWGQTLRLNMIKSIDSLDAQKMKFINLKLDDKTIIIDYIIKQTKAEWFIDNRSSLILNWIECNIDLIKKGEVDFVKVEFEKNLIKDMKAEATVYPNNKITNAVVEIKTEENCIKVFFEKNDKFKKIVKELNYEWGSGFWYRNICETTGTLEDRTAELGNKFLNEGLPIMIFDGNIRNNAIEGKYKKECTRWIYARSNGKYEGRLAIKWNGMNDKLYKASRSIPGSIWDSATIVKVEHHKEIEDFAEMYGFQFTQKALKLIEQQKEKELKINIVTPVKVEQQKEKDGLKEILESGDEILNDLKD